MSELGHEVLNQPASKPSAMTPKADYVCFELNSNWISQMSELGHDELNQPATKPSAMTPKADCVSFESISDWTRSRVSWAMKNTISLLLNHLQ